MTARRDGDGAAASPSARSMLLRVIDNRTKMRLLLAAVIAGLLALMETVAIVTVLPLVDLATGAPVDKGATGAVWRMLGEPSRTAFGLTLVVVVVALFILKDVVTMWFQWWQTGYVMRKKVELSSALFQKILHTPYTAFRQRSVSEYLRTMRDAVGQVYGSVVSGSLNLITSGMTVAAIVVALLISTPIQAILVAIYFSLAALGYIRLVRPRISRAGDKILEGSVESTLASLQGLNGFKDIKLRGSQQFFVERYRRGMLLNEQGAREGNFFSGITKYLLEILFILGIGLLLTYSFRQGDAAGAVGSLALFVAAGFRLLPNISTLIGAINSIRLGLPSLTVVHEELTAFEAQDDLSADGSRTALAVSAREPVHAGFTTAHLWSAVDAELSTLVSREAV